MDQWQQLREYEERQRQQRSIKEQKLAEQKRREAQQAQELQIARERERRLVQESQDGLRQRQRLEAEKQRALNEQRYLASLAQQAQELRLAEEARRKALCEMALKCQQEKQLATSYESPIEKSFFEAWCAIYPSIRLERQFGIGRYRVDFCHPATRTVIELDGHQYHSSRQHRTRDAQRKRWIESQGWSVTTFTGTEINADVDSCVMQVAEIITQRLVR